MDYIKEKVAYLEGLTEGMGLQNKSDEGKVLAQILEVLGDVADALDGLAEGQEALEDYTASIDDSLADMENFIDMVLDDELMLDEDDDEEDDDDLYEVICPECGHTYLADFEAFDEDDVVCPKCGAAFHLTEDVVDKLTEEE